MARRIQRQIESLEKTMTLYESMMETFCLVEKKRVSDGEGGFVTTWEDGAEFQAVVVRDTTLEAEIAEHDGVTSTWTVTTYSNTKLDFHDVIKRLSDGQTFRITSQGGQIVSPSSSSVINMAQVNAELWEIAE